jgi:hypothetical protein
MWKSAIALTAVTMLSGCADGCGNMTVIRSQSPDGRHDATLFQRDCGATTGFSTQISVLDHGASPSGSGNAFRADDDHGAAAAGSWGGSWAEVKWLTSDHLLIRYATQSRIFAQESEVSGVRITYQSVAH